MPEALRHVEPSPAFRAIFQRLSRRMMRKAFHRVRVTHDGLALLQDMHQHAGPVMLSGNHVSWWDPLLALRIGQALMPGRPLCAPIEMQEYERFGVLRKLGLFGIDPQHPDAMAAMTGHVRERVEAERNTLICITPQGTFTDVRLPVRIRPGVAALAHALPEARVAAVAVEYAFWTDKKPEVFVHALPCLSPSTSTTTAWHRVISRTMQAACEVLAQPVKQRDASAFTHLPDDAATHASIHPIYDAWLRLRGVGRGIEQPSVTSRRAIAGDPASTPAARKEAT